MGSSYVREKKCLHHFCDRVFIDESSNRMCTDGNGISHNSLQVDLNCLIRAYAVNSFLERLSTSCVCAPRNVWTPLNSQPFSTL